MTAGADAVAESSNRPLTIIAGGGSVPSHVARAAIGDGRPVTIVAIEGEADPEISQFPHEWFRWGQLGHLEQLLSRKGKGDVVLVGGIKSRPDFKRLKLDFGAVRMLPRLLSLMAHGDNTVLTGAVKLIETWGHKVVGAHEVARDLVAPAGPLTDIRPSTDDLRDARLALTAARRIGELDAGQAAVVANGRVVALEAAEGTDGVLARVSSLRSEGRLRSSGRAGVLAKCPKPQQDLRVDMPTIGPSTIDGANAAGLAGIAIEAGKVMIVDREETLRRAEAVSIFVQAFEGTGAGQ